MSYKIFTKFEGFSVQNLLTEFKELVETDGRI